ncbi:acyl-CoA thioesterase domain-containing protein [Amycolatopsis sp. La24]|uniref:acyl-CoA thioesterase n=1 Tax=Amycolatopsis sp. La24 TaxID=3028304 RepID=UPI0023B05E73|nr:acyl-CoA thioesterase domain-containing protein [Amycolatopsis sp. La24]
MEYLDEPNAVRAGSATWGDASSTGVRNDAPLLDRLAVTPVGDGCFSGRPPAGFAQRVFGGHLLAQSVLSATRTVPAGRVVNSLHAYFLRSGSADEALGYPVAEVRDGRSFSIRSVSAVQSGQQLATVQIGFTALRDRPAPVSAAMPAVPAPEELPSVREHQPGKPGPGGVNLPPRENWRTASRPLDLRWAGGVAGDRARRAFWFRCAEIESADQNAHRAILAFASDRSLIPAVAQARGELDHPGPRPSATVDHAMWFHADVRCGEWLLYVQDSPASTEVLGLARGLIYHREGTVVASVAQQGVFFPSS